MKKRYKSIVFFQQDNAQSYIVKYPKKLYNQNNVTFLDNLPLYSSDLNVIEVVWAIMK